MEIGVKIYYDNQIGNVIVIIGELRGGVVEIIKK